LHKYTEAAVKIQTRYRAYKSLASPNIRQYRGGCTTAGHLKLKNQFHHNSIDETSLNDSQDNENEDELLDDENTRCLINSDMQLNNRLKMGHKYQDVPNQKRATGKLMNIRQSLRFSPAAATSSTPSVPINLQSTLISKSQTSLNSNVIITPSSSQSINGNGNSNNNNISNNFDPSQMHHHHHHHHHYHHHFHNNNNNEIESQQQQQNSTTNMVDSSQSTFLR
jgi:hypothetical protein